MQHADELTYDTIVGIDDGTALLAYGPLAEVTIFRNPNYAALHKAQPGDYIVRDRVGFHRIYDATEFAARFEAAPAPAAATSFVVAEARPDELDIGWTNAATLPSAQVPLEILVNGVLVATKTSGNTHTLEELEPDTAYTVTLRYRNGYGQTSTPLVGTPSTSPTAPTEMAAEAVAATAVLLEWTATSETALTQPCVDGDPVGDPVSAGQTYAVVQDLDPETEYEFTVRHVGAESEVESPDSNAVTLETPA